MAIFEKLGGFLSKVGGGVAAGSGLLAKAANTLLLVGGVTTDSDGSAATAAEQAKKQAIAKADAQVNFVQKANKETDSTFMNNLGVWFAGLWGTITNIFLNYWMWIVPGTIAVIMFLLFRKPKKRRPIKRRRVVRKTVRKSTPRKRTTRVTTKRKGRRIGNTWYPDTREGKKNWAAAMRRRRKK